MPRCRIFKAVGPAGSVTEKNFVAESVAGMTQRNDLRNLAIVAHVGEQKRSIFGVESRGQARSGKKKNEGEVYTIRQSYAVKELCFAETRLV